MKRVLLFALAFVACGRREPPVGIIQGPPLTIASAPAPTAPPDRAEPVFATFVDLKKDGAFVTFRACEDVYVAVARGRASALGEDLAEGDAIVSGGETTFELKGDGVALVAAVRTEGCAAEPPAKSTTPKHVARASAAAPLVWAGGAMSAHLDLEKEAAPHAYLGRLQGTSKVAEHVHAGTWEVLCAIESAGTVTIDGKPRRVGARDVVHIPPDTKHAWTPDDGAKLIALQIYAPPGPEQRFRALAAPQDAGAEASR